MTCEPNSTSSFKSNRADNIPIADRGFIGVSGTLQGSIVVSLDQDVAFAAAESFLGSRPSSINAEVIDMVGELTNMNAGAGKDRIGIPGIASSTCFGDGLVPFSLPLAEAT